MIRFFLALLFIFAITLPCFSRDKSIEPSYIYDEILKSSNYEIIKYNYPAGSRELNLFGLRQRGQFNINAVASPDFTNLVYSEVYFYPDPRVTASALYIIPISPDMDKKDAILSISTKDKIQKPIIETNYKKLYPLKFNTYTPVDWNKNSDKILFKEKFGENYDKIYYTKIYLYDMTTETIYDLNSIRTFIEDYWVSHGVFLSDYKWDIYPLGFMANNEKKIIVKAYGYYKNTRKFLGLWVISDKGLNPYMLSLEENYLIDISANGECLRFVPDIADIFEKQRRLDAKYKKPHIEPK